MRFFKTENDFLNEFNRLNDSTNFLSPNNRKQVNRLRDFRKNEKSKMNYRKINTRKKLVTE